MWILKWGRGMKKLFVAGGLMAAVQILGNSCAVAGPMEDGVAAYNRGDYIPAIHLFRPLAQGGNARAQRALGAMYRRGQGVAKNLPRAFMWLSLASARGDLAAKAELHEMSRSLTAEELSQAREMMQACEASDYRNCEY
jgi:TPR repeat protein